MSIIIVHNSLVLLVKETLYWHAADAHHAIYWPLLPLVKSRRLNIKHSANFYPENSCLLEIRGKLDAIYSIYLFFVLALC